MRLSLKIGQHDFDVKLDRARRFLSEGHKIKVSLLFRGREITHPDLGRANLDRFRDQLGDQIVVEQATQQTGRELSMIIGMKKDAKTQNPSGDIETS